MDKWQIAAQACDNCHLFVESSSFNCNHYLCQTCICEATVIGFQAEDLNKIICPVCKVILKESELLAACPDIYSEYQKIKYKVKLEPPIKEEPKP